MPPQLPVAYVRARWIARERTAARLAVELTRSALPDDLFAYPLDDRRPVRVVIQTPSGESLDGANEAELTPLSGRARVTLWSFSGDFCPRISLYRNGVCIRQYEVPQAAPPRAPAPLPTLLVEGVTDGADYRLRFQLDLAPDGQDFLGADPVPWPPPEDYFKQIYADLYNAQGDPEKIRDVLEERGALVFEQLLPRVIRDELIRLASAPECGPLIVKTTKTWLPWEFLRVQDSRPRFLCEAFDLTRWVAGREPPLELTLRQLGLIMSADARLPTALDERQYLLELKPQRGWATEVRAETRAIRAAFGAKPQLHDWWHYVGHGESAMEGGLEGGRVAISLDNGGKLTDVSLSLAECRGCGARNPLVFFNACDTGHEMAWRQAPCGWAREFINLGAAAYLGTLWEVKDSQAWHFAKGFYGRLFRGMPIGRAVRLTWEALKKAGSIAWLLYTVYADPRAVVRKDCRLPGGSEEYDALGNPRD
jgi:hypothetical protein